MSSNWFYFFNFRKASSNQRRRETHIKDLKKELERKKGEIFELETNLEETSTKKLFFEREIRRLEEKNKDLSQKVEDLKEDMEEADHQRAQEKKTLIKLRQKLKEEQEMVSKYEGQVFKLERQIEELKSHDRMLLKERDQYSDSKFNLESKVRSMENKMNDQKREYMEIVTEKEELEVLIEELREEKMTLIKKSSQQKMDPTFLRKVLHLAGSP